jgi:hypothetical protein
MSFVRFTGFGAHFDTINNMEDYATTRTDDNQREDLPSPSIMERDQSGGSFLEHRDVSANRASTLYLSAQDQDLGEILISSLFNLPIRRVSNPALQEAQSPNQARDSSLNADAPLWDMARTSSLEPMNGASSSYHKDSPIEEVPLSARRIAQDHDQAQDPVRVPFNSQPGEDFHRHFEKLQTHPDWPILTADWLRQLSQEAHHRFVLHVGQLVKFPGREVDATQLKEWSDGQTKRTPEEQRDFDDHNIVVAQIVMEHKESDQAALQRKAPKASQTNGISATLKDHLCATRPPMPKLRHTSWSSSCQRTPDSSRK